MTEQPHHNKPDDPAANPTEREAFRKFIMATDERTAWSADRLLEVMRDIEQSTGVEGEAWTLLKDILPEHTEWAQGRLIPLVERIEMGERPSTAGFSEFLHAND